MTNTTYRSRSFFTTFLPVSSLVFATRRARAAEEAPPAAAAEASAAPEHHGSAFVDPLGFLMFGPRVGVDGRQAAHLTGGVYGRWFDPGLLGRSLFLKDGKASPSATASARAGATTSAKGTRGFHLGAGGEYLRTRVENAAALIATLSGYFVPYAEVGYRLAFDRFYAGATALLGYAARLSGQRGEPPRRQQRRLVPGEQRELGLRLGGAGAGRLLLSRRDLTRRSSPRADRLSPILSSAKLTKVHHS